MKKKNTKQTPDHEYEYGVTVGGTVVSAGASQQEGPGFEPTACVDFVWVFLS